MLSYNAWLLIAWIDLLEDTSQTRKMQLCSLSKIVEEIINMPELLSMVRPFSRLPIQFILLISYLTLVGCGGEKTHSEVKAETQERSTTLKMVDFELPKISPSSFNTPGELRAFIRIDDGELVEMALDDENALFSIDRIPKGNHQLELVFEHHSDLYGVITVARVAKQFNISEGENLLSVSQQEYQIAGLDDDNDGASNLAELSNELMPTSPIQPNNFPPEFTTEPTLLKAENTVDPLKIGARDANGHLITFSLTGGADFRSFTIDVQSGYLRFLTAPNFEKPTDKDGNNIYEVEISITDEQGVSSSQLFSVEITNVDPEQAIQNLSLTKEPPAVVVTGEQIALAAQGSGSGSISYHSSNDSVLSVTDSGQLTALSPGYSTITVSIAADQEYQAASINFTMEVINSSFTLYGWVGKDGSDLMIPSGMQGVEFYRSTDPQCDLDNYKSCGAGKLNILNESEFFDDTAHLDQVAYYSFVKENKSASGGFGGQKFTGRSGHQAIPFQGKLWVIGGTAIDGYKNDIWSSIDGIFWKKESDSAGFSPRFGHQVVEFENKLWLIGGKSETSEANDVWSSLDGIHWTKEVDSAEFAPRYAHQVVEYQNELWLVGGFGDGSMNDVWRSSDGTSWTVATTTAPFSARSGHQLLVFQGKLFVIGGATGTGTLNEVWTSTDGVQWTQSSTTAPFTPMAYHQALVYENKIWLVGGDASSDAYGVWSSADGINWSKESENALYSRRQDYQLVLFKNRLWVIGGKIYELYFNDIWSSNDGVNWQKESNQPSFSSRAYHRSVVFQGKMWIIGGFDGVVRNDIWTSSEGLYWERVASSASFSGRYNHEVFVLDDTLFLIGGINLSDGILTDIWSSTDGITWNEVTENYPFGKSVSHKIVKFQNKLWVVGIVAGESENVADVWNSDNGVDWLKVDTTSLPTNLFEFNLNVFEDKIWLYAGYNWDEGFQNGIWSTTDGVTWKQETITADFPPRAYPQWITFNGKMFLMGGLNNDLKFNDIWSSTDGLNWKAETLDADFASRAGFQIVEFQGQLFQTGGSFETLTSDVWKSNDGINWKLGFVKQFQVE